MSKRTVARARLHAQERKMEPLGSGTMRAQERGYRVPGRKLAMRDTFDFFESNYGGRIHSRKEVEANRRDEAAAYGPQPDHIGPNHWNPMHRAMGKLSTRARKGVERVLWAESTCAQPALHYPPKLSRAQLRAIRAAEQAQQIELAIEADERLLANAY